MSLLIDALRQADATRRQNAQTDAQQPPGDATPELRLEPLSAHEARPHAAVNATSTAPPDRDAPMRAATRDLFDAKRAPQQPPILLISLLATVVVLLCAGTGYYWWMTRPRGMQPGPALNVPTTAQPVAAPQTPPETIAQNSQPTTPTTATAPLQQPPAPDAAPPPAKPPVSRAPRNADVSIAPRQTANGAQSRREVTLPVPTEEGIEPATVRRTQPQQSDVTAIAPITQAYAAYRAGDYAQARNLYLQVLRTDSHNADALLALGAIALHDNQPAAAARYLRDAVDTDPNNTTARSQLALLQADADPVAAESRLRTLLAAQPANAATQFAIGSVLARQQRWNEAQQAFFQAYTLDSDNPDILYNLAVSLDQLRQPALAREYYEQALRAAQRRPASFDPIQATQRARALASAQSR